MGGDYHLIAEEASRLAKLLPLLRGRGDRGPARTGRRHRPGDAAGPDRRRPLPSPHHRPLVAAFLDRWQLGGRRLSFPKLSPPPCSRRRRPRGTPGGSVRRTGLDRPRCRCRPAAAHRAGDPAGHRFGEPADHAGELCRVPRARTSARHWFGPLDGVRESMSSSRRPTSSKAKTSTTQFGRWATSVAASSTLYYWPKEQRARDSSGKLGILHVKCVVADGRWVFLSSANLTDYAFTINMELGLLITGGDLPNRIERHFDRLIDSGTLEKL